MTEPITQTDEEMAIEADEKARLLVNMINSSNLSPLERYLLIHDFCAAKPYKTPDWDDRGKKGDYATLLVGDKIVCVGYTTLMEKLCEQIGVECTTVSGSQGKFMGHMWNVVHIKDEKYNIDDYYLADACWDATPKLRDKGLIYYAYAVMPLQDLEYDLHKQFHLDSFSNGKNIPTKTNQIISKSTLQTALESAYAGILGEEIVVEEQKKESKLKALFFNKNIIEQDDEKYEKFQDGEVLENNELEYYKDRIANSLAATEDVYTREIAHPNSAVENCFYNHKKHFAKQRRNKFANMTEKCRDFLGAKTNDLSFNR